MFIRGSLPAAFFYCTTIVPAIWQGATRAIDEFFEHRPEKATLAADKSGSAIIRKIR
jgi:hypothetical protein